MRRLIFATQKLDPDDPGARRDRADGACARGARRRARRALRLRRAGCRAGERARARVRRARRRLQRGARFAAALARELRPRPIGVVAHMVPLYAVLAAPLVRPLRIPLVLWYTHWKGARRRARRREGLHGDRVGRRALVSASRRGRCTRSATASTSTSSRAPTRPAASSCARSCSAATRRRRGSRRSCARRELAGVHVEAHGSDESFEAYKRELARGSRSAELGGPVPRARGSRRSSRAATCSSTTCAPGAPDKVVYEAAASCLPVLASNPVFDDLLPPRAALRPRRPREPRRAAAHARPPPPSRAARARRAQPLGRALGRRRCSLRLSADETATRSSICRRSPASPARRRICSRCCRGCASAAGTCGC